MPKRMMRMRKKKFALPVMTVEESASKVVAYF